MTTLLVITAVRPAFAETAVLLDGAANLNLNETTAEVRNGEGSSASRTSRRVSAEVRPGLVLQFGSPRLAWRVGYLFAGSFNLYGEGSSSYSNAADVALAAELTKRSTLMVGGSLTQGSTLFQRSQRAADAGQPGFRAPGDPDRVTTMLSESFAWEASPETRLRQGIAATLSAPQSDLGLFSAEVAGAIGVDHTFQRDAIGVELRPSFSWLRPLRVDEDAFASITNSLVGSWNRDLSRSWNGQVVAGVQQVATFAGSHPLAILPTGSLAAGCTVGNAAGSLAFTHGAATNLETGTVSVSDAVVLRGVVDLDPLRVRVVSASAGFMHAEPLGETSARVAAGTGNSVQGDVGLVWELSPALLSTVRYSVAYQFGQAADLPSSLAHALLIGLTARYGNARQVPPMPTPGRRVDGSDAVGFPGSGTREP